MDSWAIGCVPAFNTTPTPDVDKASVAGALLTVIADAIDYVCQITGSAAHVGIGTDLDGGFGAEAIPDGLDTVADLLNIGGLLRERGYREADIEAILSGNMLRKLRAALPAG